MIKELSIITALVLTALLALSFCVHAGEQSRFYDARGNSVGTATRDSQGTTVFRDSRGRTIGRSSNK
jgi:hypothetical protein